MNEATSQAKRWRDAWPDALAFGLGLLFAWWFKWNTTDLVWSLWLSSLVVGYALIVWQISEPMRELLGGLWSDRRGQSGEGVLPKAAVLALFSVGTLFGLAFFTVHFGGFHLVHSIFLGMFFPVQPGKPMQWPDAATYGEVVKLYWWFLPAAFIAERAAFRRTYRDPDVSVTPEAIARRKAKGDSMMLPYKNVMRMHLLIFFFFGAHFLKLESFLVYAVVYAVYFFPWRLLRKEPPVVEPESAAT
jgi:hypothetical protein